MTTDTDNNETEVSSSQNTVTSKPTVESFSATYVKELREENKAARKKAEALEAQLRELEPFKTKATEYESRLTEFQTTHQTELARTRLEAKAIAEGIIDPAALVLLDTSNLVVENGRFKDEAAVIEKFKADKPAFFGSLSTSSTAKTPGIQENTGQKHAKDMTPAEWKAAQRRLGL